MTSYSNKIKLMKNKKLSLNFSTFYVLHNLAKTASFTLIFSRIYQLIVIVQMSTVKTQSFSYKSFIY